MAFRIPGLSAQLWTACQVLQMKPEDRAAAGSAQAAASLMWILSPQGKKISRCTKLLKTPIRGLFFGLLIQSLRALSNFVEF